MTTNDKFMSLFQIRTNREVKTLKYYVPDLKELADVFRTALQTNFKMVNVSFLIF
jgi:hypothetical protein